MDRFLEIAMLKLTNEITQQDGPYSIALQFTFLNTRNLISWNNPNDFNPKTLAKDTLCN